MAGLGAAALLLMIEISRLLAALETTAAHYSMSVFTGFPGLPPWTDDDVATAITHWTKVAADGARMQAWVWSHVLLDALVFAPAYAYGLYRLLRFLQDHYRHGRPRLRPRRMASARADR